MSTVASVADGVGTIRLDRPERRNALSVEMFTGIADTLDAWAYDDAVAVVVITGGEDVFSAGLDLDLQSGFTDATREMYAEVCLRAYGTLLDYRKPTVAAVGGPALGGGCDIAVFSDIRVAAPNSVWGFPQVRFGLTPYFSPLWRIVGLSQAKLLTFTGSASTLVRRCASAWPIGSARPGRSWPRRPGWRARSRRPPRRPR